MKLFFFGLLIGISSLVSRQLVAQEKMTFATFADPAVPNIIIAERVMTMAYHKLGIKMAVAYLPGGRGLHKANQGQLDGELFHVKGIGRDYPNLRQVPVPIFTSELVVLARAVKFEVDGWESLKPYRIGIVRGFKLVKDHTADMEVEEVNSQDQMVQKVCLGRNDVAVDTRLSLLYALHKLNLPNLVILEPPLVSFRSYHYLHRKHQSLVSKLARVMQQMTDDGVIKNVQDEVRKKLTR